MQVLSAALEPRDSSYRHVFIPAMYRENSLFVNPLTPRTVNLDSRVADSQYSHLPETLADRRLRHVPGTGIKWHSRD